MASSIVGKNSNSIMASLRPEISGAGTLQSVIRTTETLASCFESGEHNYNPAGEGQRRSND